MDMTEVGRFDQKVGTLRLSEAIRIGARMRPQCKCVYFGNGKSCALGAAYEGAGGKYGAEPDDILRFALDLANLPLLQQVTKRNDDGMSREDVAGWLEAQGL